MAIFWMMLKRHKVFKIVCRKKIIQFYVVIASLFLFQGSFAQELKSQEELEKEFIEEVIVTAPKSLRSMKIELDKAKYNVFDIFNAMNDDNSYDILCRRERPVKDGFSPLLVSWSTRVCSTRFTRTETARTNQDYMDGYGDGGLEHLSGEFNDRGEVLTQKFNELIKDDPEFFQAMLEYTTLKKGYEKAQEENKDKGFFSSLFSPKN
jgi:hypothetical protein